MAIKKSSLETTATMTVEFGDVGNLNIVYRPRGFAYSEAQSLWSDLKGLSEQQQQARMSEALLRLVVSWDLMDDDGNQLPVTNEVVESLPLQFAIKVFTALAEKLQEMSVPLANAASLPAQ